MCPLVTCLHVRLCLIVQKGHIVHVESLSNEDQNTTSFFSCLTFCLKIKVFVFNLEKDKLSEVLWAG